MTIMATVPSISLIPLPAPPPRRDVDGYFAVVLDASVSTSGYTVDATRWDYFLKQIGSPDYKEFDLKVAAKSLEGSFVYQGDDVNDTTFMYTGLRLPRYCR